MPAKKMYRRRQVNVKKGQRVVVRGRGAYSAGKKVTGIRKYIGKGLRYAGQAIGSYFGGSKGGEFGRAIGKRVSKFVGTGKYRSSIGLAKGGSLSKLLNYDPNGELPAMHSNDQSIRFRYREYLGDITGSTAFNLAAYSIQPGLTTSFPFLSQIAANFQEYRFHGLCYYFKSTTANAISSTNGSLGTVIMATDYNASNANFINKIQMLDTEFTSDAPPVVNQVHCIEEDPRKNQNSVFYVRTGALTANQDIKLFDVGNFQIASQGQQSAFDMGELYVIYDISLLKPILGNYLGDDAFGAHYTSTTYTSAAPLTGATLKFDNIGLTFTTGTVITFPINYSGYTTLYISWIATNAVTVTYPIITTSSGVNAVSILNGNSGNINKTPQGSIANDGAAGMYIVVNITSTGVAQTITFGAAGTIPTSVGPNMDLFINQINPNML